MAVNSLVRPPVASREVGKQTNREAPPYLLDPPPTLVLRCDGGLRARPHDVASPYRRPARACQHSAQYHSARRPTAAPPLQCAYEGSRPPGAGRSRRRWFAVGAAEV